MLVQSAINEIGEIATLPEVTVKIIQIVENPKSTARDLHDVIRNDPALAARILKVVNSAFYGLPGQIGSVDRAIVLLGLSAVKNIAIAASMTRLFQGGAQVEGFNALELWRHSITVGVAARLITAAQGRPSVEESFLAGLIHDLGLLVVRQVFPRKMADVLSRLKMSKSTFIELENEIIGADHQTFGMALATKWRFPRPICAAIGYHHAPGGLAAEYRELPMLVYVADHLACKAGIGFSATGRNQTFDSQIMDALHITEANIEQIEAALPEQVSAAEAIFRG
jgi:HD-like signal output (HDOD) protein